MSPNQKRAPRLEAPRLGKAAATKVLRERLRPYGQDFDLLMRAGVLKMARSCGQIPEPAQMFYDVAPERGRPPTVATLGTAIAAVAQSPKLPDNALEEFCVHLVDWVRSIRPQPDRDAHALWSLETHAQAAADPWQALALRAIETGDVVLMERAIETTGSQLSLLQQYHVYLIAQYRETTHQKGQRRFA
jgi:hypothetical protein